MESRSLTHHPLRNNIQMLSLNIQDLPQCSSIDAMIQQQRMTWSSSNITSSLRPLMPNSCGWNTDVPSPSMFSTHHSYRILLCSLLHAHTPHMPAQNSGASLSPLLPSSSKTDTCFFILFFQSAWHRTWNSVGRW